MKPFTSIFGCLVGVLLGLCFGCASASRDSLEPGDQVGLEDPLVVALRKRDYTSAERLLRGGYPVGGQAAFQQASAYWAIIEGDLDALQLLIRSGLDVNFDWGRDGGNLLTNAVQFGHIEQVRTLVESGASLIRDSRYGRSPLYSAVIYDQKAIEDYLRARGAKFNEWDLDAFRVLGLKPR